MTRIDGVGRSIKGCRVEHMTGASIPRPREVLLATAALRVASFVRERGVRNIILSGRSSGYIVLPLFIAAWKELFPQDALPQIHIFNDRDNQLLYRDFKELHQRMRIRKIRTFIKYCMPALDGVKECPICYIDDFMITGEKYLALRSVFKTLGFDGIVFAFLVGFTNQLRDPQDFVAVEDLDLRSYLWENRYNLFVYDLFPLRRIVRDAVCLIR